MGTKTNWSGAELCDLADLERAAFLAKHPRRTPAATRMMLAAIRRDGHSPEQARLIGLERARRLDPAGAAAAAAEAEAVAASAAAAPVAAEPPVDPVLAQRQRMTELATLREQKTRLKAEAELAEALDCLGQSLRRLPVVAPIAAPALIGRAVNTDEELVLLYSDGHKGALVDGKALGGLGGYDAAIWHERHDRLREAVAEAQRTFRVGRLNIFNLGDNVEGQNMRPSQAYHIDTYITDQVAEAGQRKALDAAFYSTIFDRVDEFGVGGNHARVGNKGDAPYAANWDRLVYWIADRLTADYKNVTWHLPRAWFQVVQRGKTIFVLVHGDDIKSWLGIPYYGLQRARMRYQQALHIPFDYVCVGHFHQPYRDDYVLANGSMLGATEYAAKELVSVNLPSQKLLLLNRETGVSWVNDVVLGDWAELRQVPVFAQ